MDNSGCIQKLAKEREEESLFYEILDHLLLAQFKDCKIVNGQYRCESQNFVLDVRPRSFYFQFDPIALRNNNEFKSNSRWSNKLLKFGLQITASTGKTYSYPALRDFIDKGNGNQSILRASYFFSCILQVINFIENPKNNKQFIKIDQPT